MAFIKVSINQTSGSALLPSTVCQCRLTHDFPRRTLLTLTLLQDNRRPLRPMAHQHSPPQGLCYHRAMEHLSLKTQKHIGFPNQTFLFLFPLSPIISSLDALKKLQRVHFRNNFLTYKLGFFCRMFYLYIHRYIYINIFRCVFSIANVIVQELSTRTHESQEGSKAVF